MSTPPNLPSGGARYCSGHASCSRPVPLLLWSSYREHQAGGRQSWSACSDRAGSMWLCSGGSAACHPPGLVSVLGFCASRVCYDVFSSDRPQDLASDFDFIERQPTGDGGKQVLPPSFLPPGTLLPGDRGVGLLTQASPQGSPLVQFRCPFSQGLPGPPATQVS